MATLLDEVSQETSQPTAREFRELTEQLWRSYDVISEWIQFADVKAGALLTIDGVVFGAALSMLRDDTLSFLRTHPFAFLFLAGFGISLVLSAIASLDCIRPRVNHSHPTQSLIFFEEIAAQKSIASFDAAIKEHTQPEAAYNDIRMQVWSVSKVASRKHKSILWSVRLLYAAVAMGFGLLMAVIASTRFDSGAIITVTKIGATQEAKAFGRGAGSAGASHPLNRSFSELGTHH